MELKEAVVVSDQTQTKDPKDKTDSQQPENSTEQALDEQKSVISQAVTRERIERVKRAFRPSWLIDQIFSEDAKKGK